MNTLAMLWRAFIGAPEPTIEMLRQGQEQLGRRVKRLEEAVGIERDLAQLSRRDD